MNKLFNIKKEEGREVCIKLSISAKKIISLKSNENDTKTNFINIFNKCLNSIKLEEGWKFKIENLESNDINLQNSI